MDRKYIENEHIVDRYLSGDLTVRAAREFENFCLAHPHDLRDLPIPARLKARLSRPPTPDSDTGVFNTIPSSTTHTALAASEEGFDAREEQEDWERRLAPAGVSRTVAAALGIALIIATGAAIYYAIQARALTDKAATTQRELRSTQLQPFSSVQIYKVQMSRGRPAEPTLAIGWLTPPQLFELHVDATEGKFNAYQITIDKVDGGRAMIIRRLARDSNRELRLALNSSAFGPGDYLFKFEGYDWRGNLQEMGWLRLGLQ